MRLVLALLTMLLGGCLSNGASYQTSGVLYYIDPLASVSLPVGCSEFDHVWGEDVDTLRLHGDDLEQVIRAVQSVDRRDTVRSIDSRFKLEIAVGSDVDGVYCTGGFFHLQDGETIYADTSLSHVIRTILSSD